MVPAARAWWSTALRARRSEAARAEVFGPLATVETAARRATRSREAYETWGFQVKMYQLFNTVTLRCGESFFFVFLFLNTPNKPPFFFFIFFFFFFFFFFFLI